MKAIFREYGKTIFAVCVTLVLVVLAAAMLTLAGSREKPWGVETFEQYQDGLVTRQLYTRQPPQITWIMEHPLEVGSSPELSSCFQAEDAEGDVIPVTILSVCDGGGNACEMPFDSAGVYRITATATDRLGKTSTVFVDVPVR